MCLFSLQEEAGGVKQGTERVKQTDWKQGTERKTGGGFTVCLKRETVFSGHLLHSTLLFYSCLTVVLLSVSLSFRRQTFLSLLLLLPSLYDFTTPFQKPLHS